MGSNFTALFDACVLYPAPLRDLLMQLALTDLFRARWTNQIHDEWINSVLANRSDLTIEQLTRTRKLMDSHDRDCLIKGYEYQIPVLELPDPNDRHVLAAAIKGNADVIVTFDLKDFPNDYLSQFEIEAQHPDNFILDLLDLDQETVREVVLTVQKRLKKPPKSMSEYLETLKERGLGDSVSIMQEKFCQI